MEKPTAPLSVRSTQSIREAIASIDAGGCGITLVVDDSFRLQGTLTDGDIRRAMLEDLDLELPVSNLLERKVAAGFPPPVTAPADTTPSKLLHMMVTKGVRQIPLLDSGGVVVGLSTQDELVPEEIFNFQAVVMAGGLGSRLRPLTDNIPKPMLPVDGKPLMERIVNQLRAAGIRRVNVTTHYKAEAIEEHFGDGRAFGVDISYVNEASPLGTAGALRSIGAHGGPLLVINGDILTGVDFRAMVQFHLEQAAAMTVGVLRHEFHLPYGVVTTEGVQITSIEEKPSLSHLITAGMYVLNPVVLPLIPSDGRCDMPDLISLLVRDGQRVVSFGLREYWQDIGRIEDYEQAVSAMARGEVDR